MANRDRLRGGGSELGDEAVSDLEERDLPPLSLSETDAEGNTVTWVAAEGLGAMEAHVRLLELLFSPSLGS
jgi:hypothetical protein